MFMRIVIKVGTNVLTDNSQHIQISKIIKLISEIFTLREFGHEVILVSSGAIGFGKSLLPNLDTPRKKSVWAAIGQPLLMQAYINAGRDFNLPVAQCLLLRDDFTNRERYGNFVQSLEAMLFGKILPIINENDVMATQDLTVGDNDVLAAMVSVAINAEKLILLTNQAGLFTDNPDTNSNATLVSEVKNVDAELEKLCSAECSALGRGGMLSKVRAAKHAVHAGIETFIADGSKDKILLEIINGKQHGTKFVPLVFQGMSAQKRWLMSAKGFGELIIDDGAVKALQSKKSLLAPGIIGSNGQFEKKEIVQIVSKAGLGIAYGRSNYSSKEIQDFLALRKINKKISLPKEVVHYDYMIILKI